jgi:hypothetical protein
MNPTITLLLQLSGTCALQCLFAMRDLGTPPFTQSAISEAIGESPEAVKRGLRRLKTLGYVDCDQRGGHETNWHLTRTAKQLPLPLDLLDTYGQAPAQPDPPADRSASDPAPIAHARLQAGNAASPTPLLAESTPQKTESGQASIIIISDSSDSVIDSIKKNTRGPTPQKTESKDQRHIRAVLSALAVRGLPVRDDADPFPIDLRLCVNALVKLSCPRKRAELVVARSQWNSDVILKEIARWQAHKRSAAGASITDSGFPFLVAARIENCEPCPTYAYQESDLEQPEAQPNPPDENPTPPEDPPFPVATALPQTAYGPIAPADAEHWQMALDQLRLEMNHSTFDASRLLDTWIARIEGEAYHIAVANQYARDWLDNRLNATVTRVLKNIVGHDVTVRFVAPGDPPEHS